MDKLKWERHEPEGQYPELWVLVESDLFKNEAFPCFYFDAGKAWFIIGKGCVTAWREQDFDHVAEELTVDEAKAMLVALTRVSHETYTG